MRIKANIFFIVCIVLSIIALPGCYYDKDDLESAYDNGQMDGYDAGYSDGYHDALVDNGLAKNTPKTAFYESFDSVPEKHLSFGNIVSLIGISGCGVLLIMMVVCPIVDSIKKKKDRERTFNKYL